MFSRIIFSLAIAFFVALVAPAPTHAQTTDVQKMLERMQTIMQQMTELQKEFKLLSEQLQGSTAQATPAVLGAQTSIGNPVFTETLAYGETNDDIKRIQKLLATDPEIYPYGVASGFFGPKTEEAIKNLQGRFDLKQVGVIGPATTALLESYMRAYPDGNYPDGVLSTKPKVLGVSTSAPAGSATQLQQLQSQLSSLTGSSAGTNPARSIEARFDDGETWIDIKYNDGTRDARLALDGEDEEDAIDFIVSKTKLTKSHVEALIEFSGRRESSSRQSSNADEGDAEDALDDADAALDEARDEIRDADDDGDDIDWADETYDEARSLYKDAEDAFDDEEWDEAVELAEEAEELAEEAIDRIDESKKSGSGDVDEIIAYVGDDEAEIFVEFADGDDDDFIVDSEDEDDIIEEVADELGIDEDEVEDIIEFRGKRVDAIYVEIDDDESFVDIDFEDGTNKAYSLSETDEDDIIDSLARKLKLSTREIERAIDFD